MASLAGCGDNTLTEPPPEDAPSTLVNAFDVPIDGLSDEDVRKFNDGDALFGLPFRAPDGLGPLYIRTACSSCHAEAGRGPGLVQKMVVVEADGITPAADQSALAFGHTIRQGLSAGATQAIVPPNGINIKLSIRVGPPVIGRGYVEAVLDSEIERIEAQQAARSDGIHGTINRVTFTSVPNPDTSFHTFQQGETGIIGRFGMKGRIATIDDFTADAFQGDMGMTTPMRPTELANPEGLLDDGRPGVDLPIAKVDSVTFYLRHIAIPRRVGLTAQGRALFVAAKCAVCHVPELRTRADYPIAPIANIQAPIYSDLLLHDMGQDLADGVTDGDATSRLWKTTPLIGLRFFPTFMHDGRSGTIEEAILAHAGEALGSADAFRALSSSERAALVQFVEAL
ncbi:MAG: di-heme oxidoredictase family protein [Kofleriaceae bacterium]